MLKSTRSKYWLYRHPVLLKCAVRERVCSEVVQNSEEVGEVEEAGLDVLFELLEQSSC